MRRMKQEKRKKSAVREMMGWLLYMAILVAVAFNGLYQIVYQRMLVYGLAGSILKINIIILVVVFPLSIFCATKYGINGGGIIWVTVSVLQIILGLFFTKKC